MSAARRVAVVTGAASGIGAEVVSQLRHDEFDVVGIDLVAGEASDRGFSLVADVSRPDAVDDAFAQVRSAMGRIDVLVNNAGTTGGPRATTCHETSIADWERVVATNLTGAFLCTRAVLEAMCAQGSGHIINVASIAGVVAFPQRCAYSASKAAVLGLTRSVAADYAASGIRANAVCPGMVETPMTQWRLDMPALRAQVVERTPMGRVGEPREIAAAIALLAGGQLPFMTGHALVLDGGWTVL